MNKQEGRKKAIRIRIEDTTDGKVEEFETDCMALYTADFDDSDKSVNTRKVRNFRSLAGTIALIKVLESASDEIKDIVFSRMLSGQEGNGNDE